MKKTRYILKMEKYICTDWIFLVVKIANFWKEKQILFILLN